MGGLGWIDFSPDDRQRAREVLALLKEPGTLDELGVGSVRDAYSDLLFPGFSTIQTRARYFLAVPKIFRDWSDLKGSSRRKPALGNYLAKTENELAGVLKANYEVLGLEPADVIGHTRVEQGGVARRPSSTYWNGLRTFGIVRTKKSLAEFCRIWGREDVGRDGVVCEDGSDDDEDRFDDFVGRPPDSKGPWRAGMTLTLTRKEAEYLAEQFSAPSHLRDSVASQLIKARLTDSALDERYRTFAAFSHWAGKKTELGLSFRKTVLRAQRLSMAVEGAHIVFNRLIAKNCGFEELGRTCKSRWSDWRRRAEQGGIFHTEAAEDWLGGPDDAQISVTPRSRDFLEDWNTAMCSAASDRRLDDLVQKQALESKKNRSLLVRLNSGSAPAAWYGMAELNYRWPTARKMLLDVAEGLRCSA